MSETAAPTGSNGTTGSEGLLAGLIDKLVPTAEAQTNWPDDFGYDELWNEPRNLVGAPRNRAVEATRIGSVLPEGSNFEFAIPIVGFGVRNVVTNLTLFYNSRVWSRRSNSVAFDAISGWPGPGFFNTSLPVSGTNAAGLTTTIGYNAALQASSVTLATGANASANFDYGSLSASSTQTYDDLGTSKTLTSTTQYDGWGRVIYTVSPNDAQLNTSYDPMGRVISRTNLFQSGGSPGPATTIQYDLANRAVITTLTDGNTTRTDHSGSTVTLTDQVNRKIKREADGLGRLIKVTEQTSAGALTQETNYSYSLLDKLTLVNQGNQGRAYKYDAKGRLIYEKIPEQTATINDGSGTMWTAAYAYTEYGAVKKKTDARGVESHYSYDTLHNVTQIWFTGVGGDDVGSVRPALPSGVAATGDRNFGYTSWGTLSSVTLSNYTETYAFDSYFRVSSVTRWIQGQTSDSRKTYTTSYEYNLVSQLSKMTYPSGQQVAVNHDDKGRMQSLTYEPGDIGRTPDQLKGAYKARYKEYQGIISDF